MTHPDCPRLFEAEARRDGRLTGVERASFERHLATCPACAREVDALEALAGPLRDGAASLGADELHARRERLRLLSAFERSRLGSEAQPGVVRRWWPALAAALVVVMLGVVFVRSRSELASPVESSVASATIHAQGAATWSRQLDEHVERVVLSEGTLRIQREHRARAPRLVVVLPDGELEDIGTTFYVSVSGGRTTRVVVDEGRVVLRLRGRAPVTLARGGTFTASAPVSATSALSPALDPSASSRGPASTRTTPASRVPAVAPTPAGVSGSPSAAADDSASRDFRAATAALDAGDNSGAAAGFARFLAQHARDARAEDAAYLRVIALQRSGGVDATRRAASDYLRRYPRGFRRAEVEALLGD